MEGMIDCSVLKHKHTKEKFHIQTDFHTRTYVLNTHTLKYTQTEEGAYVEGHSEYHATNTLFSLIQNMHFQKMRTTTKKKMSEEKY